MKRILCGALSALLIFTGIQLPVRAETAGTEETAAVQPEETAATEPEETAATEPVESVPEETQAPETIGPDANERAPQAMTVSDSGIAMLEELEGRSVSSFRTALTQVENSVNSFLSANGLTLTQQQFDALGKYAINLNEQARSGKLDPVIGRDEEIRRVLQAARDDAVNGLINRDFVQKYIDRIFVTVDNDKIQLQIKLFTSESTMRYLEKLERRSGHTFKKMIESYEQNMANQG
jgi:hypothetical protein